MNLETINKWLDEEYGCSYTRLEELHDFYFEKYCDLKQENQELKEQLEDMTLCRDIASGHRKEVQDRETILLNQQKEFISYLENEKDRLARECSQIYEDSLGKTRLVNEDIFNEVNDILQKYKSIIGVLDEKSNNIPS